MSRGVANLSTFTINWLKTGLELVRNYWFNAICPETAFNLAHFSAILRRLPGEYHPRLRLKEGLRIGS